MVIEEKTEEQKIQEAKIREIATRIINKNRYVFERLSQI